ncbi:transporter substrate-binding protein [Arthrospira platensis]|uniref:ABC transporter substrate-binding protein n=3 Tax=Limnospira platensis TaxID=118562 RepID=A0A5M3T6U2_LIMPL|nr:transporter substrate-binding protein [Arthrospira platensis]AMW27659.1 ABC transporter substrate-binding protein [Arthrospira platensis YZ]MBD2669865.1 transporter substrate-binding protein [Arthrospira platensis FACHB-439]MBD2711888.1 transporter substrate-binding protein [Arthrospira platensis FACHB-835]MDF2209879.1 transporter substrate-binding protein [Arthrospira platensis NCB002]MDT9183074.1 transporter substrate-binding protein [Limnospira sp. PMC 289.06]MDT9295227.1 transporter su
MPGVRVGILHSLSGTMAISEAPLRDAELMAIREINQSGGILGKFIEPVIEDCQSDPACFAQKAKNLIQDKQVVTLFGCWTSASRQAVKPVLEELGVGLWYPVQYEGLEESPNIFHTGACANQQVEPAVSWLLENIGKRFYLLGSDYTFPHTVSKLIKIQLQQNEGHVVGEAYQPLGAKDFSSIIARIVRAKPDVVFNTLTGDSNIAFYRQFQAAGLSAKQIPVLAISVSETELKSIGNAATGHLSCWSYFQSLETPENRRFVKCFKARYGSDRVTSDPIEAAYSQVYLWKQAVELAESFDPERVRIATYGQSFSAPSGIIRMEPNHHIRKLCRIGRAKSDGQFEIIYTSPHRIKPLPWLGFEANSFNASEIVIGLLAEVSQSIERAEKLKQKTRELEETRKQLEQEIEIRKQVESQLQVVNEDLENIVAERTAALRESNNQLLQEIVERTRVAEALRMANARLQAVLEAVPGTVSWISSDLRYLEVNQSLADLFKLPRETFANQHIGFLGTSSEFNDFVSDLFNRPEKEAHREVRTHVDNQERHYLIVAQKYDNNRAVFVVGIDITQRRQAEEELRQANMRLQAVLAAVPGTVSWVTSDLHYIEVNQKLANLYGLPREAFSHQHIGFLGRGSQFQDFLQYFFESPELEAYQEISSSRENEEYYYLIAAHKYNNNQAAFVVGIDISDRKRAEAALKTTQDQLEAVLNVVPGTVSWIDSNKRYLGVNQYLAQTFDLPAEAFIGQHIGFLKASPEFNGFVEDFFNSGNFEAYKEVTSYIKNEPRDYLIAARKYNSGSAAFFVGIDITDRRRAEEALKQAESNYRSIFENALEGIFQTTPEGRYISANPALARIYGYESPTILMTNLTDIQSQLYIDPKRRQEFVDLLESQGSVVDFESQIRRIDGQVRWISENATAVRSPQGEILYYEGTVEDITDRKLGQIGLQQAKDELENRVAERTAALQEANHHLIIEVAERRRIEAALRASEAELRALFAAMTDVIAVFDGEGRYKKIVTTNAEVVYTPSSDLLGKTVFDIFPTPQAQLFYENIQKVIQTGETINLEYSMQLAPPEPGQQGPVNILPSATDADLVWFAATVSPMPDNSVIWVARNTTERRRVLDALRVEQQKSERLLLNILPRSIAERLKQSPHSIAERFDQATVMFADLVNFTGFSAQISPTELVDLLNDIFSCFDELAQKHQLEKIKTIGDSYMVVGGLPTPVENHAEAIAHMALDMQREIVRFRRQDGEPFNLRIGINTGPVVAGVIGTRKFIYDLWGDAVNVASRMESQGEVGRIQITAATKAILKDNFIFEERGVIDVKGRGKMVTFWLKDRR